MKAEEFIAQLPTDIARLFMTQEAGTEVDSI